MPRKVHMVKRLLRGLRINVRRFHLFFLVGFWCLDALPKMCCQKGARGTGQSPGNTVTVLQFKSEKFAKSYKLAKSTFRRERSPGFKEKYLKINSSRSDSPLSSNPSTGGWGSAGSPGRLIPDNVLNFVVGSPCSEIALRSH